MIPHSYDSTRRPMARGVQECTRCARVTQRENPARGYGAGRGLGGPA